MNERVKVRTTQGWINKGREKKVEKKQSLKKDKFLTDFAVLDRSIAGGVYKIQYEIIPQNFSDIPWKSREKRW